MLPLRDTEGGMLKEVIMSAPEDVMEVELEIALVFGDTSIVSPLLAIHSTPSLSSLPPSLLNLGYIIPIGPPFLPLSYCLTCAHHGHRNP